MFTFAQSRTRRKPALTPMIDVVFLLLVFFMLAAQFGRTTALDLVGGGDGGAYDGPPRLVSILPEALRVNGLPHSEVSLVDELLNLTESTEDLIVLRAQNGANVQRLTDVATLLGKAGFTNLVLVE